VRRGEQLLQLKYVVQLIELIQFIVEQQFLEQLVFQLIQQFGRLDSGSRRTAGAGILSGKSGSDLRPLACLQKMDAG
jgi:hypothetical protein